MLLSSCTDVSFIRPESAYHSLFHDRVTQDVHTIFTFSVMMSSLYSAFHITYCFKAALQKFSFYSPNWALYGDLPCLINQCPFWFFLSLPLPLGMNALAHASGTWHMLVCHPPIIMLPTIFARMQIDVYLLLVHSKKCEVVSTQFWVKYGLTQLLG